ncbi:MAG: M43 family zinc metalloprotease [Dyadobacter sp.]
MLHFSFSGKSILIGSFLVVSASVHCFSQERAYRVFSTQKVIQTTKKEYPEYQKQVEEIEKAVSTFASRGDDKQTYQVPVIFHLVETKGQKTPDEEQIRYQLDVLNKCFGSYEPEKQSFTNAIVEQFTSIGVNPGIQFYIPETIEGVKGIDIVNSSKTEFATGNEIQNPKTGGIAAIDSEKVINVWVGKLEGYSSGYAHFPGAPADLDGIVIDPEFFGNEKGTAKTPYTQGKTLVHLMGTYLGLYELWNESDPCADDMVADTPIHNAPNSVISKEANSKVITMCHGYIQAMYMNFMDNSDDEMLTLFTQGQKDRMRAMLADGGLRNGLVTK